MTALLLLLPTNSYTMAWHIASYQFNGPDPFNPVWQQWQQEHADEPNQGQSPAMKFGIRFVIFLLVIMSYALISIWQSAFAEGPVARYIAKKYGKAVKTTSFPLA